jgi:hypothetical protein
MNVRFHHEPWDDATETEFVGGMGAILAGYLRDVASSGQADGDGIQVAEEVPPAGKSTRRRGARATTAGEEASHG